MGRPNQRSYLELWLDQSHFPPHTLLSLYLRLALTLDYTLLVRPGHRDPRALGAGTKRALLQAASRAAGVLFCRLGLKEPPSRSRTSHLAACILKRCNEPTHLRDHVIITFFDNFIVNIVNSLNWGGNVGIRAFLGFRPRRMRTITHGRWW